MSKGRLILASNSKARAELLDASGIEFKRKPVCAREPRRRRNERFAAYLLRLALLKANAAAMRSDDADWVLAADTAILFRGKTIGKPGSPGRALRMLSLLQGKTHTIGTAVCVLAPAGANRQRRVFQGLDVAKVSLRRLDMAAIRSYVATAKPLACAGAYALQGGGAAVLRKMSGDPSTVVGLPLGLTDKLLRQAGFKDRFRPP